MNELDITFDDVPTLQPGQTLSALTLLAQYEDADEETLAAALEEMAQKGIALDVTSLPKGPGVGEAAARLALEERLVRKGDLLQQLPETDPLRLYLEEIAALPVSGDPELLAQQLTDGKEETAHRLAEAMFGTVVETAKTYVGRGVLLLDLIQEASMGLWQSIQTFSEGAFLSHCEWWLHQYLAAAVTLQAKASGVGQKLYRAVEDYRSVDEKLLTELGRNPTLEEMAEGLHMGVEETAAVAEMLENARSLRRAKAPEEKPLPEEEDQAVEDTAYFQMRQRIAELLSDLPAQDVQLLTLRYGLEGGLPMDPKQVGARLGLTEEEVVNREAAALSKLRQHN